MTKGEQAGRWDDDDGSRGGVLPEYFAFRYARARTSHTQTHTHTQARGHCMHFTTSLRVLILYISVYFRMCTPRATEVKNRTIYGLKRGRTVLIEISQFVHVPIIRICLFFPTYNCGRPANKIHRTAIATRSTCNIVSTYLY